MGPNDTIGEPAIAAVSDGGESPIRDESAQPGPWLRPGWDPDAPPPVPETAPEGEPA